MYPSGFFLNLVSNPYSKQRDKNRLLKRCDNISIFRKLLFSHFAESIPNGCRPCFPSFQFTPPILRLSKAALAFFSANPIEVLIVYIL